MSDRLPELRNALPADAQLDGELVAWDDSGRPDWHRLGARVLHGDTSILVDVLACEGLPVTMLPYLERWDLLEQLDLERPPTVQLVATFEDGEALSALSASRASKVSSPSAITTSTGWVRGIGGRRRTGTRRGSPRNLRDPVVGASSPKFRDGQRCGHPLDLSTNLARCRSR
jgi:hypothetical protein